MARTTLDLDPTVLRELRKRAGHEGKSMGEVASELLAGALHDDGARATPVFEWQRVDLGRPLVDLEDGEAVWAILDGRP
ncbi:MAG: antitoxin [Candidatus Limnocylindrales bacterium]